MSSMANCGPIEGRGQRETFQTEKSYWLSWKLCVCLMISVGPFCWPADRPITLARQTTHALTTASELHHTLRSRLLNVSLLSICRFSVIITPYCLFFFINDCKNQKKKMLKNVFWMLRPDIIYPLHWAFNIKQQFFLMGIEEAFPSLVLIFVFL